MSHKFTFTHKISPVTITIEVHEDVSLPEIIEAFESYLKACEYNLAGGHIELIGEN